jgi:hypothetical protein
MAGISELDAREAPRARRWDALILGSGLPSLVAAARISAAGLRVLVVEEVARTTLPPALREPFMLAGLRDEGVLDACLRGLTVPLIDRRRIEAERLAFQIADDPRYRLDVGQPGLTADELSAWGLCEPDEAQTLVRHLLEASETERKLLLASPLVRIGRRLGSGRTGAPSVGSHKRGLPGDVATARDEVRRIFDAQIRALSNLGAQRPTPEAQARLLGLGLAGGAGFSDQPPWLVDLLRKRATALYCDFRSVAGRFELVSVSGQPGIRVDRSDEIWIGRTMLIGTTRSGLGAAVQARQPERGVQQLLGAAGSRGFRASFLFRVPTRLVPEGMSARLILPGSEPSSPTVALTAFPGQSQPGQIDLVARAMLPDADAKQLPEQAAALQERVAERVRGLMPFCGDALTPVETRPPLWDSDDGWLEDPGPGEGWPSEIDLRLSSRPPVYHLDRACVAGLGLEGDLLLGWRGGDAIAQELS